LKDLVEIGAAIELIPVHGHRYSESAERMIDR
jgi:hypothetical protein